MAQKEYSTVEVDEFQLKANLKCHWQVYSKTVQIIQKSCESVNELPYIIQLCKNTAIEKKFMKQ